MRKMLHRLISCLAVMLFILTTAVAQSPPEERPKLKNFGSSLDRLKWDSRKQAAVEIKRRAKPGEATDDDIIRVETNLVVCDIRVRDSRGNTVTGLTKDDFIVTEDNHPQQIQHFSLGNDLSVGRTIVLLIDYSGSERPYIRNSVEAANILVDQLGPKDVMAVVTDDVKLLVDFTRDKKALKKKLDTLAKPFASGRSKQFSALMAAVREMFTNEDIRPIIIFQTDGDEVFDLQLSNPPILSIPAVPTTPPVPRGAKHANFNLRNVYEAIEKSRVSVYTIIPGPRLIRARTEKELVIPRFSNTWNEVLFWGNVAAAGAAIGGWTAYFQKPEEANDIYARILADINSRYVIGYYPANKMHDGNRRNVLVEVRDHPEYSVSGRKSYIAPEPEPEE